MDNERKITDMLQKLTEINTKLDTALNELSDHETRLRMLEGASGKRWDSIVTALISVIVGAVAGLFIGHFGL